MSASTSGNEWGRAHAEPVEKCKVVVLYDDEAARLRAERICQNLAFKFQDEAEFEVVSWEFDQLMRPVEAQNAAALASDADLVIFSTTQGDLPPEASNWLQAWQQTTRAKPDGVIGLLTTEVYERKIHLEESVVLLEQTARLHHMDFLTSEQFDAYHKMHEIDRRAKAITPLLQNLMDLPEAAIH